MEQSSKDEKDRTINLLEENIIGYFKYIVVKISWMHITINHKNIVDTLHYIKNKKFCLSKESVKSVNV